MNKRYNDFVNKKKTNILKTIALLFLIVLLIFGFVITDISVNEIKDGNKIFTLIQVGTDENGRYLNVLGSNVFETAVKIKSVFNSFNK